MKTMNFLRTVIVLCLLYSHEILAFEPTWGIEFTFSNSWVDQASTDMWEIDSEQAEIYRELFKRRLEASCGEACRIKKFTDKNGVDAYRVELLDPNLNGWGFDITNDPGCVEIVTRPATYAQFKSMLPIIESYIFEVAKNAHLVPMHQVGGGHLNVGFQSTFYDKPLLFRNWIVDMANHPEIGDGFFESDFTNSPTIAALSKTRRDRFAQILKRFDQGKFRIANDPGHVKEMQAFAAAIDSEVYTGRALAEGGGNEPKYHHLANYTVSDNDVALGSKRSEIRGISTHYSASQAVDAVGLFNARLEYLSRLEAPITYRNRKIPSVPEKIQLFQEYVTQSGFSPKDFASRIVANSWKGKIPWNSCSELDLENALSERNL